MMRNFAVALIATTMLVAPALAADAVKTAAPAAPAATAAPADTSAPKADAKSNVKSDVKTNIKTIKVAHRHHGRHMTVAKNGGHASHMKTAKVSKPVAPAMTWFTFTAPKADKPVKTVKVAHRHTHHMTVAKNGKPVSHVKTTKVANPAETPVASTPAAASATPAVATVAKPDVKVIKASKEPKKGHLKTSKVSKPVQPTTEGKAGGEAAHEVKGNKVISN